MTEVAVSSGADEWEEEDGDVCIGDEDCGYSPGGDPGDGIVRDTLCLGPEEILRLQLRLDVARLEVECRLHEREKLAFAADTEKMKQLLQQAEHVMVQVVDQRKSLLAMKERKKREEIEREQRRRDHFDWIERQSDHDIEKRLVVAQALGRAVLARKAYRVMTKSFIRRQHIAQEMLETEQFYVESLKKAIKIYKVPLRYACSSATPILREWEIKRMFGNIEQIWEFHRSFLQMLEASVLSFQERSLMGRVFCKLWDAQSLYEAYSRNHNIGFCTLERANKNNEQFKKFTNARQDMKRNYITVCLKAAKRLDLAAFLIMPIQRIPRYSLLLKDLIKHTPEDHYDMAELEAGMKAVQRVAGAMNHSATNPSAISKLMDLEALFTNEVHFVGSREFVSELDVWMWRENLTKHSGDTRRWQAKRGKDKGKWGRCMLLSDMMVIASEGEPTDEMLIQFGEETDFLRMEDELPLMELSVEMFTKKDGKQTEDTFCLQTSNVRYTLECEEVDNVKQWLDRITSCKDKLKEQLLDTEFRTPKQ